MPVYLLRIKLILLVFIILVYLSSCKGGLENKGTESPIIELTQEFDSIYKQALACDGWEDGLHISNDGLTLYCTYLPVDFLSFIINGDLPNNFSKSYLNKAPTFGMDLKSNPIGATEWLHSDILISHRNSIDDNFVSWQLSDMARNFYSEGAPAPTFNDNGEIVEFMLFTSNDNATNNTDIWMIENTVYNPSGIGQPLPHPINTNWNEDNPHMLRINGDTLVLFFESNNRPGGKGDIDIWFSESENNGKTWSTPTNLSINSEDKEHQPFLHKDLETNNWFLYYSALGDDGKLAIFRRKQSELNNWNSWGKAELVISAGKTAGIGEATLTKNGDISFVVVHKVHLNNSKYYQFDCDPWFVKKINN